MFFLQFIDLPVHFHFHQKVDDGPGILFHKSGKVLFIRTLNRQQHLRPGIHVTRELHFGLRILVRSNIHLYDVPENVQHLIKTLRVGLRNTKRTLGLRKTGDIRIQHIKQRTSRRTLPQGVAHNDQHFVRASTGRRLSQMVTGSQQHYGNPYPAPRHPPIS